MQVIDLSHTVTNGMPVFPGTPPVNLRSFATVDHEGFNELEMRLTTHIGTHIDCPLHIIKDGFDTTTDANKFYGRGIKIDCSSAGDKIPLSLLQRKEEFIRIVDFVILYSGWDKFWGDPDYFGHFPVLSADAAEYLNMFNLKGIGIDAPSFDAFESKDLPVHHRFLSSGRILIENLTNLRSLQDTDFYFSCLPLKVKNGDGCPVRAIGIILNQE